jgi:hypothetical protein
MRPPIFAKVEALVHERTLLIGRLQALADIADALVEQGAPTLVVQALAGVAEQEARTLAEQVSATAALIDAIDARLAVVRNAITAERARRALAFYQPDAAPMRH